MQKQRLEWGIFMKKLVAVLAGLLLGASLMVTAVGCGNNNAADLKAEDVVAQVQENMNEMKAISMNMNIGLDITNNMASEDNQIALAANVDLTTKQDPLQIHMSADVSGMGTQSAKSEVYIVPENDGYVGYMGVTDEEEKTQWLKKTVSEEDCKELEQAMKEQLEQSDGKSVLDTVTLMNKALTMKVTGRETVNNVGAIVIESELKMDDFLALVQNANLDSMIGSALEDAETTKALYDGVTVPFTLYVDEEKMVLTRCTMDLAKPLKQIIQNVMNSYMISSDAQTEGLDVSSINLDALLTINKAELVIDIKGFNDTVKDIIVPSDVKKNAVESGEFDTDSLPLLGDTQTA